MGYRIFLSPPETGSGAAAAVRATLEAGWLSARAPIVAELEDSVARELGADRHAVATSSGTAALHLALRAAGVGPGDRVICPALTFVASANPIVYLGAEPVFVDVDPRTWTLEPELVRRAGPAKAVIAVDLYGHLADYARLRPICRRMGAALIEDAAEALGATSGGRPAGTFGDFAIFSFNANKLLTGGGGGMAIAPTAEIAAMIRRWANQSRTETDPDIHDTIGFNYGMPALAASVLAAEWATLEERIARRRAVFARYRELLHAVPGIAWLPEPSGQRSTRWLSLALVDSARYPDGPARIVAALARAGIQARRAWKPLPDQPVFAGSTFVTADGGKTSVAEQVFRTAVCLPSGGALTLAEQREIADHVARTLQH